MFSSQKNWLHCNWHCVFEGEQALGGGGERMGPPHGLLHAKKATLPGLHLQFGDGPFPAGAYFMFSEFLPKGASSSPRDRGSSFLGVRPWGNPLKIAENWADNEIKASKMEEWRINNDGIFLADTGFFERDRPSKVPKILLIGLRSCAVLHPLALKFSLKDWGCLLVITWIPISSYNITLKPHQCFFHLGPEWKNESCNNRCREAVTLSNFKHLNYI